MLHLAEGSKHQSTSGIWFLLFSPPKHLQGLLLTSLLKYQLSMMLLLTTLYKITDSTSLIFPVPPNLCYFYTSHLSLPDMLCILLAYLFISCPSLPE